MNEVWEGLWMMKGVRSGRQRKGMFFRLSGQVQQAKRCCRRHADNSGDEEQLQ